MLSYYTDCEKEREVQVGTLIRRDGVELRSLNRTCYGLGIHHPMTQTQSLPLLSNGIASDTPGVHSILFHFYYFFFFLGGVSTFILTTIQ